MADWEQSSYYVLCDISGSTGWTWYYTQLLHEELMAWMPWVPTWSQVEAAVTALQAIGADVALLLEGGGADCLKPNIDGVAAAVTGLQAHVQDAADQLAGIRGYHGGLLETIQAIGQALGLLTDIPLSEALGKAPIAGQPDQATVGGSFAQALWNATLGIGEVASPMPFESVGKMLAGLVGEVIGSTSPAAVAVGNAMDPYWKQGRYWAGLGAAFSEGLVPACLTSLAGLGPTAHAGPEGVWQRAALAYGSAVGLGVVAHAVSGLMHATVIGTGGVDFSGAAALIGQAAGFGPIVQAVMGNFYQAFLDRPMQYEMNKTFTPNLPGMGDVLRLRAKRIIADRGEFNKLMAYQGFSADWIERFEQDLYTEPRHTELQIMGDNDDVPAEWWAKKCRALGYEDQDVEYMVGGLQRRLSRGYLGQYIAELQKAHKAGVVSESELDDALAGLGINRLSRLWAVETAWWRKRLDALADAQKMLADMFERDQIAGEGYRDALEALGIDQATVTRTVASAEIRRFRKVYWTTPAEDARKAVGLYRTAFIAGLVTGPEYETVLTTAGMQPAIIALNLSVDGEARNRRLAADFRQYQLPALRDQVLHGVVSLAEYRYRLEKAGFPAEHLDAEVCLVRAMLERRQAEAVRRDQLPHYRRAFIVGLVTRECLVAAMKAAGLDAGAIAAAMLTADEERRREEARARAAAVTAWVRWERFRWDALLAWLAERQIPSEQVEAVLESAEEPEASPGAR